MKDESIRKLYVQDTRILEDLMGFSKGSLEKYAGRYVKIALKSPARILSITGRVYLND
jgi:hypothetical protein